MKPWVLLLVVTPLLGQSNWYRGNIHTHTDIYEGDINVAFLYKTYNGYQFVAVTDHNIASHADQYSRPGFTYLDGEEVTTSLRHFGALGYLPTAILPGALTDQHIIDKIHEYRAIPILNHPRWAHTALSATQILALKHLGHIEMFNGLTDVVQTNNRPDLALWDQVLSSGRKLFAIASDDMHKQEQVSKAWIMVNSASQSRQDLLSAIRNGQYYCTNGIILKEVKFENQRISVKHQYGTIIYFVGKNGVILKRVEQSSGYYDVTGTEQYVRVEVTNPDQKVAFTQPIVFTSSDLPPRLRVKVMLQGALRKSGSMALLPNIPLQSPYDATTVTQVPVHAVDWVQLELRSLTAGPATMRKSVFLRQDGWLEEIDGTTDALAFNDLAEGYYYAVVRHRNHLSVMSSQPMMLARNELASWDFTLAPDRYYGSGGGVVLNGVWALWAGDANGDGCLSAEDYRLWVLAARTDQRGYLSTDFTLDGRTTTRDALLWSGGFRRGAVSQVP